MSRLSGIAVPVRARDLVAFHLTFSVPRAQPDDASGRLVVVPESEKRPRQAAGPPRVVRVATLRAEDVDVRPDPAEVELHVERTPPFLAGLLGTEGSQGDKTTVILRGRGSEALLNSASGEIPAVLRGTGRQVVAYGRMAGFADGQIEVAIDVDEVNEAGRFVGRMVYGDGVEAPSVEVIAVVRTTLWVAIALIFLGVVVGQLVPRLLERYRLRAQLISDLGDAVRRYRNARRGSPHRAPGSMDLIVGRREWDPSEEIDADDQTSRLRRALEATGSPDELRVLDAEVRAIEDSTRRWLSVEQAAAKLRAELAVDVPPRARGPFSATPAGRAVNAVMAKAESQALESDADATRTVKELGALEKVLPLARSIWILQRQLDAQEVPAERRAQWELEALWPQRLRRGDGAFGDLLAGLIGARDSLLQLREQAQDPRTELEARAIPFDVRAIPTWYQPSKADRRPPWQRTVRSRVKQWVERWGPELIQATSAMAVASAVYALTLYGDTWGSEEDYITAFAAGFLGRVAVDVAHLQLFRRARVKPATSPAAASGPPSSQASVDASPPNGGPQPEHAHSGSDVSRSK